MAVWDVYGHLLAPKKSDFFVSFTPETNKTQQVSPVHPHSSLDNTGVIHSLRGAPQETLVCGVVS